MKPIVASQKKRIGFGLGKWAMLLGLAIVLAGAYWVVHQYDITEYLQPARFVEFLQSFGMLAPAVFVGIMALAVVVSPIPSLPLDLAAGAAFGPLLGTIYAVLGAEIGAIISFLIGRALGQELLSRLLKTNVVFCEKCSDHHLIGFIFFARLLPLFSFDLVSYGAGLTTMSLKAFALATLVGMIPPTFALVYFGSSAMAANWLLIFLSLLLIGLLIVLPKFIMRNQASWWVQLILGKKPEIEVEPAIEQESIPIASSGITCSWCGAKDQDL